jgi:hypothetical protein
MVSRDRVAGVALVLFALYVLWEDRVLPLGTFHSPGPGYMPMVLALLLAAMGGLVILAGGAAAPFATISWTEWRHAIAILGCCIFAAVTLERLGYRLTVALLVGFLLWVVEKKGIVPTVLMAAGLALATYYVFATVLLVPLPLGPWGF